MYEQTLYKIVEPIKKTTLSRLNKNRKWEYGYNNCLLYTSPSPRDVEESRMPSSA